MGLNSAVIVARVKMLSLQCNHRVHQQHMCHWKHWCLVSRCFGNRTLRTYVQYIFFVTIILAYVGLTVRELLFDVCSRQWCRGRGRGTVFPQNFRLSESNFLQNVWDT